MTHEQIQIFAVIHLATVGVSHIVAHQAWAKFFIDLAQKGTTGVFVVGLMSLGFGSLIAAFHPVWTGVPVVLTVLGWAQVAKGASYLCFPAPALRRLEGITMERSRIFMIPGIAFLGASALLLHHLITS